MLIVTDDEARQAIERKADDLCESDLAKFEVTIDKDLSEESRARFGKGLHETEGNTDDLKPHGNEKTAVGGAPAT